MAIPKLVTLVDAADRLGLPIATLRYWRYLGKGPKFIRLGRRVVISEADLNAWLKENLKESDR
jgi:predicted site-specific integrase-resolvase